VSMASNAGAVELLGANLFVQREGCSVSSNRSSGHGLSMAELPSGYGINI